MKTVTSIVIGMMMLIMMLFNYAYSHNAQHLGQISFATSGSALAQPFFEKGVMLLHSFQYEDARDNFKRAEEIDKQFALAYWGEAMTYNHPLWGEQEYDKAIQVLSRLAQSPEERVKKARSQKEKGLINAVNQLYGKGSKALRDKKYTEAMRKLYSQLPEDDEVAILYSLAIMGEAEGQREERSYMQAASIAEDVYERNKNHPGTLHYTIHAFDDPIHAPLGLRAARAYAKVAPSASHALHMPSHIFNAMGLWDDVIKSNQAAWDAGLKSNPSNHPKAFTIHDLHALHWLAYGYLQKNDIKKAYELTTIMESIADHAKTPMSLWYYAQLRAAFVTDGYTSNMPLKKLDDTGIELSAVASNAFSDTLKAKYDKNIIEMKKILARFETRISKEIPDKTYPDYFTSVTKSGVTVSKIVALEIKALIANCEKEYQKAITLLRQAAQMEDKVSFGYGPPLPVKPSFEMLADILMQQHQFKEAYEQYVITLKRLPNRMLAKQGLQEAKKQMKALNVSPPDGIKPFFHRLVLPEYFH